MWWILPWLLFAVGIVALVLVQAPRRGRDERFAEDLWRVTRRRL